MRGSPKASISMARTSAIQLAPRLASGGHRTGTHHRPGAQAAGLRRMGNQFAKMEMHLAARLAAKRLAIAGHLQRQRRPPVLPASPSSSGVRATGARPRRVWRE